MTAEEKTALERLAAEGDLTVGQLVRRTLQALASPRTGARAEPRGLRIAPRRLRGAPDPGRERELRWLARHVGQLSRYAGHWIVLEGDELIAHGEDYLATLAEARRKGVQVPFVERIAPDWPRASSMGL